MNFKLTTILIAYLLDLVFGDPQMAWHPVRILGYIIGRIEKILNKDKFNKKLTGTILVILVIGVTVFSVWGILKIAYLAHPFLYHLITITSLYFAFSVKDLAVEVSNVYKALKEKDILKARHSLSMIVARDTENLDEPDIIRASVETTAESIMDGIIAPLFYAFLGGPVLVWIYKAINTLDSMVGYRSERFIEFGKVVAKIDGLANFIPAKLTCFFINISSLLIGKDTLSSLKWGVKYLFKGLDFNSEATEAAMAGALRIQLGGLNFYNSLPLSKPFIGDKLNTLEIKHIKESIKISYLCSLLMLFSGTFLFWLLGRR